MDPLLSSVSEPTLLAEEPSLCSIMPPGEPPIERRTATLPQDDNDPSGSLGGSALPLDLDALVVSVVSGFRAFELLMECEGSRLLRAASRIAKDKAHDAVQDASVSIVRAVRKFRLGKVAGRTPYEEFHAWAQTVAKNAALRLHRDGRHLASSPDFDEVEDPNDRSSQDQRRLDARDLSVRSLSELGDMRDVCIIVLAALDFSSREIGVVVGMCDKTVRCRLSRARASLGSRFGRPDGA